MNMFLENIGFAKNRLLLYKFKSQDLEMKQKKTVRDIQLGLNISKEDDDFLKKLSELNNKKSFRRGNIAHDVFQIGLQVIKKQIKEELGQETETSYLNKRKILKNNESLNAIFNMVELLSENGLTLEIKEIKEQTNETK